MEEYCRWIHKFERERQDADMAVRVGDREVILRTDELEVCKRELTLQVQVKMGKVLTMEQKPKGVGAQILHAQVDLQLVENS